MRSAVVRHASANLRTSCSWSVSMAEADDRKRLHEAAVALGPLAERVVFVGGTVTSLMITDPAAPATRVSLDVDAITDATNRAAYYALEEQLRKQGFGQKDGEPICRWFRGELIVDVMPNDERILGFSNRWYPGAFASAEVLQLEEVQIRVIGPVWFLATKLEAFDARGEGDYQASRDVEDIVAVLDGRPSISEEIANAQADVRSFVQRRFAELISDEDFLAAIVGHVGGEPERATLVRERMTQSIG
jgi:hypothetical protein